MDLWNIKLELEGSQVVNFLREHINLTSIGVATFMPTNGLGERTEGKGN